MHTLLKQSLFLGLAAPVVALAQPDLRSWDPATLYQNGWSAREMIDTEVRGNDGEAIGEVKDILVDRNGRISRIVAEVGGFLEMGDQHIGVPWSDIKIGEDMEFVQVPLREVQSGSYSLFGRVPQGEDVALQQGEWRVNELIGDYASVDGVPRYGIVTDVIFDNRAMAKGVIVDRALGTGPGGRVERFGYPYAGYRDGPSYRLPWSANELARVQRFDYVRLNELSRYAGKRAERASAGASGRAGN
jgi:sporulation protein YlmC with PRC-barrel domain